MSDKFWKISDFAKNLNKHPNTIDGWFRNLESERNLHYILRVNGEKVYDELDYEIASFIIEQRNNKWSLNAIFDSLPEQFSLRPFPNDFEHEMKAVQVMDFEQMRATLMNEIQKTMEQVASAQVTEQTQAIKNMLPSREQQRFERFNEMMAERKITRLLEKEATDLWNEKPKEERLKKVGWFRKEENTQERDIFIRDYIDERFEAYMKKEFDME